jgi:hypothetical protein
MSSARLLVTAVRVQGRSKSEVARDYRVSRRWVYELVIPPDVIVLAVRWHLRFALSYRDVEELLAERRHRGGPRDRWSPAAWMSPSTASTTIRASSRTLKEGRALRVETVTNSPDDLGVGRRLCHLDELQARARAANRRLLDTQAGRPGLRPCEPSLCAGRTAIFGRRGGIPNRGVALRRSPGHGPGRRLRVVLNAVVGFTHRSLRAQVAALLGTAYSAGQMSYDLTRLRRKGLIQRLPRSNTYVLTADGVRFALFYTKVHDRLLVPLLAANQPPAPAPLRNALEAIDRSVADYVRQAPGEPSNVMAYGLTADSPSAARGRPYTGTHRDDITVVTPPRPTAFQPKHSATTRLAQHPKKPHSEKRPKVLDRGPHQRRGCRPS